MKNLPAHQNGAALIFTLIMMSLLAFITYTLLNQTIVDEHISYNSMMKEAAFIGAEGGIHIAEKSPFFVHAVGDTSFQHTASDSSTFSTDTYSQTVKSSAVYCGSYDSFTRGLSLDAEINATMHTHLFEVRGESKIDSATPATAENLMIVAVDRPGEGNGGSSTCIVDTF